MRDEARDVLPQRFRLDREETGSAVVLSPHGELDIATADSLVAAAESLPAGTALVVVDLRGVTFIDSSGLRGLLLVRRRADRDGLELLVCHDPALHGPIFRLTHLEDDLPLVLGDELAGRLSTA